MFIVVQFAALSRQKTNLTVKILRTIILQPTPSSLRDMCHLSAAPTAAAPRSKAKKQGSFRLFAGNP